MKKIIKFSYIPKLSMAAEDLLLLRFRYIYNYWFSYFGQNNRFGTGESLTGLNTFNNSSMF